MQTEKLRSRPDRFVRLQIDCGGKTWRLVLKSWKLPEGELGSTVVDASEEQPGATIVRKLVTVEG